jgi:hypothetical protein
MLNVIILNVIMLSVIKLNVITLNVIILNVIMLIYNSGLHYPKCLNNIISKSNT